MADASAYNPLDYANLTRNCVEELMRRGPYALPLATDFAGAGVYALFYTGELSYYQRVRSADATWPIYVGKAVPPGARKGRSATAPDARKKGKGSKIISDLKPLYSRIAEHTRSIQAVESLRVSDFSCRYLVVTPLWITMAERFLIEHYRPVWNVCIEGFGNHAPGKGRSKGEIPWWDTLHPGRSWATELRQSRTDAHALDRLAAFLQNYEQKPREDVLRERPSDATLLDRAVASDEEPDDKDED